VAEWLHNAIIPDYRDIAVEAAVATLSRYDFDTIAVSGVSGLLHGPIVATR
jgi:hypothetical protein